MTTRRTFIGTALAAIPLVKMLPQLPEPKPDTYTIGLCDEPIIAISLDPLLVTFNGKPATMTQDGKWTKCRMFDDEWLFAIRLRQTANYAVDVDYVAYMSNITGVPVCEQFRKTHG